MKDEYWRDRAMCVGADPELFFSEGRGRPSQAKAEAAKQICRACPVVTDCLRWALAVGDDWAVVDGTTPEERRQMGVQPVLAEQFPPVAELVLELPGVRDRERHTGRPREAVMAP